MAAKMPGVTGENLLRLLESRLDNVIYRLGFANSRAEARQFVLHGHFTVNGRKVNIPSFLTKVGQVIAVKESSRQNDKIKSVIEANSSRPVPKWLDLNRDTLEAKIVAVPNREEIDIPIEETLIVELYSK
jgi:small subunit ribosomal protein S4